MPDETKEKELVLKALKDYKLPVSAGKLLLEIEAEIQLNDLERILYELVEEGKVAKKMFFYLKT